MNLKDIVEGFCSGVVADIESDWQAHGNIEGNAFAQVKISEHSETHCKAHIVAVGQKAWILEYGKGSKMDLNNRHLDKYMLSNNYNPLRKDMVIRGRPKGIYKDLDGNTYESSGRLKGVSLEHLQKDLKIPFFDKLPDLATEPKYIMRNALHEDNANKKLLKEDVRTYFKKLLGEKIKMTIKG